MPIDARVLALAEAIAADTLAISQEIDAVNIAGYFEDLDNAPLGWVSYNESLATNPPPIGNGVIQTFTSGDLKYQVAYGGNTGHVASRLWWMGTWGAWKVVYSGHESWDGIGDKPSSFPPSTHSHVQSDVTGLGAALAALAPLASPALTGNPTAPTQSAGNSSTRLATTAFVQAALNALLPVKITQSAYNALGSGRPQRLYAIVG